MFDIFGDHYMKKCPLTWIGKNIEEKSESPTVGYKRNFLKIYSQNTMIEGLYKDLKSLLFLVNRHFPEHLCFLLNW